MQPFVQTIEMEMQTLQVIEFRFLTSRQQPKAKEEKEKEQTEKVDSKIRETLLKEMIG